MQTAQRNKAEEQQRDQAAITADYLRRRTRQRFYYLGFATGLVIAFLLLTVGLLQGWLYDGMYCLWQIAFLALAAAFLYLSWRNWRCPACDSWLSGIGFQVNALWSPASVHCPHCGTKLQ